MGAYDALTCERTFVHETTCGAKPGVAVLWQNQWLKLLLHDAVILHNFVALDGIWCSSNLVSCDFYSRTSSSLSSQPAGLFSLSSWRHSIASQAY